MLDHLYTVTLSRPPNVIHFINKLGNIFYFVLEGAITCACFALSNCIIIYFGIQHRVRVHRFPMDVFFYDNDSNFLCICCWSCESFSSSNCILSVPKWQLMWSDLNSILFLVWRWHNTRLLCEQLQLRCGIKGKCTELQTVYLVDIHTRFTWPTLFSIVFTYFFKKCVHVRDEQNSISTRSHFPIYVHCTYYFKR